MNAFIEFIPSIVVDVLFTVAILSMWMMFICEKKKYTYVRVQDDENADYYDKQSTLWDFSCQMSIGAAGLVLCIKEDDPWFLFLGAVFYLLAFRTYIKLKKSYIPNGIEDKE